MKIRKLQLYLTSKCNMSCQHCQFKLQNKDVFNGKDMDFEKAIHILNYFRNKYKVERLATHSLGEVLMYPNLIPLVKYANFLGYNDFSIATNGLILNEYIDFLLEYYSNITISLDGYDRTSYKRIRGDFFPIIYDNIKAIIKRKQELNSNANIIINSVIGKNNLRHIKGVINLFDKLASNGLKIDYLRLTNYHHLGGNNKGLHKGLYADDWRVKELYKQIKSRNDYNINITLPVLLGERKIYTCGSLEKIVTINHNGVYIPCCRLAPDNIYGNFFVKKKEFMQGEIKNMQNTLKKARNRQDLPKFCQNCDRLSPIRDIFDAKDKKWKRKNEKKYQM